MYLHEPTFMTLELWHFKFSHYNEKVRWALDHKAIEHERHVLVPGFHVPTVLRLTGQPCTPVIAWDGETVWDSTAIIAKLEERVPEPALYPEDPSERERALALEDWFDENVGDMWRGCGAEGVAVQPTVFDCDKALLRAYLHLDDSSPSYECANCRCCVQLRSQT